MIDGIVIDSSAIVAILRAEPEASRLARALERAPIRLLSTATLVETGTVLLRRLGPPGLELAERFVVETEIELVPFSGDHARAGLRARLQFGRGRHAASLNLGDCFTYALSAVEDLPILCLGNDFAQTDRPVVPLG